jgi:hypothetical protein
MATAPIAEVTAALAVMPESADLQPVPEPQPSRIALPMWEPAQGMDEPAMAMEDDLVELGIGALEAGDEPAAYALSKRATQAHGHDVRAWFWRAKTAETLDEVIECLQRALKLEPTSSQIKANLDWAIQRRQQAKAPDAPRPIERPERPGRARTVAPSWLRAPSPAGRLLRWMVEVARAATALAAFVVAAVWLLTALPGEVRETILSASGMSSLPLPDAAGFLLSRFGLQLGMLGGYNLASALPYGLGFLALFVGLGLLSAEGWTRLWAPLLGVASAWVWLQVGGPAETPAVLAGCAMVALGGVLTFNSGARVRPAGV